MGESSSTNTPDGQGAPALKPMWRTMDAGFMAMHARCDPFTMTGVVRQWALCRAVRHVWAARIPGSLVECGVWRGGSAMLAALTLIECGGGGSACARELWLYDTFAGMAEPGEMDRRINGREGAALEKWREQRRDGHNAWAYAPLDEVRANMASTGFPEERVRYVVGDVRETIPGEAPEQIALLRLDTDFYESTRHEMEHLFPRLSPRGVLIVDDYGVWEGSKRAVDEYFEREGIHLLLTQVDETGVVGVKEG